MSSDLTLLWLEPTPPGSAARTHLDGTLRRLTAGDMAPRQVFTSRDGGHSLWQKLRRLTSLVRRARAVQQPGILIARWHPFVWFISGHWQRRGGKVLLLVQGNDATVYESYRWFRYIPFTRRMVSASLRVADRVLVLNEGLLSWVREYRREDQMLQVLPTGVSDVFIGANADSSISRPYVLFFGNLAPWQGIDYLLQAKASPAWPTGVDLRIVGDGELRSTVEELQSDSIQWNSRMSPELLAPVVAGALVTVCPKLDTPSMSTTTTPFKMLESAAAGVPVIATDIPAQRAIVERDRYGILVTLDDPAELARAIKHIHMNSELRRKLSSAASVLAPSLRWEYHAAILNETIASLRVEALGN